MSKIVPSAFEAHRVGLSVEGWQGLREEIISAVKAYPYLLYGPGHGNPKTRASIYDAWLNKWLNSGVIQPFFSHESGTRMTWDCPSDKKVLRLLIKGEAIKVANNIRRSNKQVRAQKAASKVETPKPSAAEAEFGLEAEAGAGGEFQGEFGVPVAPCADNPERDCVGNIWYPIY